MAKKIRFPLEMPDGAAVRSLEELREHFDLKAVLEYFRTGKLVPWLENHYCGDEAEKMKGLDADTVEFSKELCAILGVEMPEEEVDYEAVALRVERLEKLKQYTSDEQILKMVDCVAFDQDEIYDRLDEGCDTIYLCGENISIPSGAKECVIVDLLKKEKTGAQKVEETQESALVLCEPYALFYDTQEWLNESSVHKLVKYDVENRKKEVLRVFNGGKEKFDKYIVKKAKSKSFLWCCYRCEDNRFEISKMDLYGNNEEVITSIQRSGDGYSFDMWANDKNAYIKLDDYLYQVDSNGQLHELGEKKFFYGEARITDSYFTIVYGGDINNSQVKVVVYDNDTQAYDEYCYQLKKEREGAYTIYERISSFGIYDGKISFVKVYGREHGEFSFPVVCALDRENNKWDEYPLPKAECFTSKEYKGNAILSYEQIEEDELFIQSGPLCGIGTVIMEFSTYNIKTGKRNVLRTEEGKCSVVIKDILGIRDGRAYVHVDCGGIRDHKMLEIDLKNRKCNVIVEGDFWYNPA